MSLTAKAIYSVGYTVLNAEGQEESDLVASITFDPEKADENGVEENSKLSLTITPKTGYEVIEVKDGGKDV